MLFLPCRPDGSGGEGGGGEKGGGGGAGHLHPPRQANVRHSRRVGVRYEPLLAAAAAAVAAAAAAAAVAAAAIHLATVFSCSTESTGTFPSSCLFGGHGNLLFFLAVNRVPEILIIEGLKPHLDVPGRS